MKDTFIIRTEWMDAILDLQPLEKATLLDNLFYYHSDQNNLINLNNLSVKLVWKMLEPNLKRNIDNYDKRILTSKENGKKGGRPTNLKKPKKPNVTLNDSVSDSDSDSVSDSVLESENKKEIAFEKFWDMYDYKVGKKDAVKSKFKKLSFETIQKIFAHVPTYKNATPDKTFRKHPSTYLNQEAWNDEIIAKPTTQIKMPLDAETLKLPMNYRGKVRLADIPEVAGQSLMEDGFRSRRWNEEIHEWKEQQAIWGKAKEEFENKHGIL